jgi:hypothetical protein
MKESLSRRPQASAATRCGTRRKYFIERIYTFVLLLLFIAGVNKLPGALAADATVNSQATLITAISAAPIDGTPYEIEVAADFTISASTVTIAAGQNIRLTGDSATRTITRASDFTGNLFTNNGALTVSTLIIDGGGSAVSGVTGALINNAVGATLTLNSGAILQNNIRVTGNGGGVAFGASGTLEMTGDAIIRDNSSGRQGGGVYFVNYGTLTMTGDATISGNSSAHQGGGAYFEEWETITLSGRAKIDSNHSGTATDDGGLKANGAGIRIGGGTGGYHSQVNLSGYAAITNNTAGTRLGDAGTGSGGLVLSDTGDYAHITLTENASISNNHGTSIDSGGGVYLRGEHSTISLSGNASVNGNSCGNGGGIYIGASTQLIIAGNASVSGNISNGAAGFNVGGGIFSSGGKIEMSGTSKINGNNAYLGGGVYLENKNAVAGTFTMSGGFISGNQAYRGGGVYLTTATPPAQPTSTFTMSGGEISNNHCEPALGSSAGPSGGGVLVAGVGSLTMSGGIISGNLGYQGGGVFLFSATATFDMQGGIITGNHASTDYFNGAASNGGGVISVGIFNQSGGTISNNTAANSGGGVRNQSTYIFTGGTISGNTANVAGGGIYTTKPMIIANGTISGNSALGSAEHGSGGGVYTERLKDLETDGVVFSNNTAPSSYSWNLPHVDTDGDSEYDDDTYNANINNAVFAADVYLTAYNNADINYVPTGFMLIYHRNYDGADTNTYGIGPTYMGAAFPLPLLNAAQIESLTWNDGTHWFVRWLTTATGADSFTPPNPAVMPGADVHIFAEWGSRYVVNYYYDSVGGTLIKKIEGNALNGTAIPYITVGTSIPGVSFSSAYYPNGTVSYGSGGDGKVAADLSASTVNVVFSRPQPSGGGDPTPSPEEPTPTEEPVQTEEQAQTPDPTPDEPAPTETPTPAHVGGTDPNVPPIPANPGGNVVARDDGVYIELDADGVPLGEWHWDEEIEEWVFDEYPPPLADFSPGTGDSANIALWAVAAAVAAAGLALTAGKRKAHKK